MRFVTFHPFFFCFFYLPLGRNEKASMSLKSPARNTKTKISFIPWHPLNDSTLETVISYSHPSKPSRYFFDFMTETHEIMNLWFWCPFLVTVWDWNLKRVLYAFITKVYHDKEEAEMEFKRVTGRMPVNGSPLFWWLHLSYPLHPATRKKIACP